MARRRRRDDLAVQLFPFLSVLACVIGTLTLILAAIAVGRLGGSSVDWIRLAEQLRNLREVVAAGEARLESLQAQLREARTEAERAEDIGERLTALGLSPQISLEELTALVDLAKAAQDLDAQRAELLRTRSDLDERVARDERTFAERREIRDAASIIIEPSGVGREWRPFLMECGADYLEYYDTGDQQSRRIARVELHRGDKLPRLLRYIRNTPRSIVIFLIRPDGVDTCQRARALADAALVRSAELPLPGNGPLDLRRLSDGT